MWQFFLLLTVNLINLNNCIDYFQPEQIHLAYGDTTKDIVITWSTFDNTKESIVQYGNNGTLKNATGTSKLFVDGGSKKHSQFIHRVLLKDLQPNSKYVYHCGSNLGWSEQFWFVTPPEDNWQPYLAVYGDMGNINARSLVRLQQEVQQGKYDAILHVGDFAYDMDTNNAEVGDAFMRQIQPIAGYLPYMTCPGNHEESYNFSNYRERFSMPCGSESYMYSINIGPIHLISISTELYYFLNYGLKPLAFQYEWLVNDLAKANQPENRAKQPWIIVMGHRPMYCSNDNTDDCTHHETLTRVGLPFVHLYGLEDLLYNNKVDLEIWAHEHSYERLWPIYNYKVYNGSKEEPYTNPKAPVHIITGSAGCQENTDPFKKNRPPWSAFVSDDYGYTRLKVYNATHLYMEQVSDDKNGAIIDSMWLIKDQHVAYPYAKNDEEEIDSLRFKSL